MTLTETDQKLKAVLKESRYLHSLSVADTAKKLALKYGADADKAYIAGLVHDCAKCFSKEELMEKIKYYGIALDEDTLKASQLLHSFVGAFEAKEVYGIDDGEIFDAIYYHTIGKENMPPLTAIIYLADAIEPLRNYPGAEDIRREAETSLEKAIYLYTLGTIEFVKKKGEYLHPNAIRVRDFYSRMIK